MPNRRALVSAGLLLLSAAVIPAQTGLVHSGTAPGNVHLSSGWTRSLAAQPDGRLWCLVREDDGSATAAGMSLLLFASTDHGATWTVAGDVPTIGDGRGAIAAGRACDLLHVTWNATDTGTLHNLYYQAFDTATMQWVGTPELLLAGTNANDQYYADDIAVTARGTIGITFNTHRTPTLAGFTGWSGGLLVRRVADATFQGPFRLNTDTYGMLASVQAVDEVFHTTFRTNTGLYGIRYRAFDAAGLQFVTTADVPIYGANQSAMRATNSSTIATDSDGNLYVLYSVGTPNVAGGALEVAFAARAGGYSQWVVALVESDPALTAGNVTYQHYTLARADNGSVFAVFAKAGESFQNLYLRILTPNPNTGGAGVLPDPATTPAIPIALTTENDTFARVDGLRAEALHSGGMVAVGGAPTSFPNGYVSFVPVGSAARALTWGTSCQGNLPLPPRMTSLTLPKIGASFDFGIVDAPASAAAIVFAGVDCMQPPLDLTPAGFPGCAVFTTPIVSNFVLTDPAGAATLSIAVPATFSSFTMQFAGMIAAGANPGGAVFSNALSATFF